MHPALQNALDQKQDKPTIRPALMGDGANNLYPFANDKSRIYVRENRVPTVVYYFLPQVPVYNTPCFIGRDGLNPGIEQVIAIRRPYLVNILSTTLGR